MTRREDFKNAETSQASFSELEGFPADPIACVGKSRSRTGGILADAS